MEINTKYTLENRRFVIGGAVVLLVLIFIIRLFFLQVVNSDYKAWADSNAFQKKTLIPSRGIIYDRNGKLLVYNQPSYEVMLVMREIQPFDTLDFCNILGITKELFVKRIAEIKNRRLNPGYSSYVPQVFMNHLSAQECGVLQEKLYKFPGFYIQNRTIREYEYPYGAHLLGNIGEVNQGDIEKDPYYVQGDNAGRSGVELSYEEALRGVKGVEILLRDAHGRIKGRYEEGRHDVAPVSGKNLTLSIDMDLQALGEKLMQNKRGSIVMIEPETGEVLCLVGRSPAGKEPYHAVEKFGQAFAGSCHHGALSTGIDIQADTGVDFPSGGGDYDRNLVHLCTWIYRGPERQTGLPRPCFSSECDLCSGYFLQLLFLLGAA